MIKLDIRAFERSIKRKNLSKIVKPTIHKAKDELSEMTLSQVPVDTGALYESFFARVVGDKLSIGYRAPYAMHIHENLSASFLTGKAKFLEDPIREYGPIFRKNAIKAINEVVK